jgi:copper chaperone NosL
MRRVFVAYGLVLLISLALISPPVSAEEVSCKYCGMYLSHYKHSWMVISYKGLPPEGFCSVHCGAISMALHSDRLIERITVGDYNSKAQIDAEKANWVIGGDLPGVMTARAKWAFATRKAADAFMAEHGGQPASFEEVLEATFDDMLTDTMMIRKKRQLIDRQKKRSAGQRE